MVKRVSTIPLFHKNFIIDNFNETNNCQKCKGEKKEPFSKPFSETDLTDLCFIPNKLSDLSVHSHSSTTARASTMANPYTWILALPIVVEEHGQVGWNTL